MKKILATMLFALLVFVASSVSWGDDLVETVESVTWEVFESVTWE